MKIETTCNTPDEVLFNNIAINSARNLPWLKQTDAHDGHAVIVGGGASVKDWIDEIRMRRENGQVIFALNGAAKYLMSYGIMADFCVIVDARERNADFLGYTNSYLLSSQVSPFLFNVLEEARVKDITLWHQEYPDNMPEFDAALPDTQPEHTLIGGGTTVGLSAMVIAYALGYRALHLYGYDSSYTDDNLHAYAQNDPQRVICDVTVAGKTFKTTLAMAKQAELFPQLSDSLIDFGCTITIRGDGLLPFTSKMSTIEPEKISEQEKYQKMWEHSEYRHASPGESRVSLFLLAANPKPSDTVIDFGAGTGRAALRIHKMRLCNVIMLDFADNCLDEEVRANISEKLRFNIADLTQPIPHHAKYGYCTDVLEHIPTDDVEKVIKNIMNAADNV
ncbi:MAG: 6-hydroxymethylpterin diphosphokinase MptE-like protein, partial [Methylophilus sp.]